MTGAKEVSDKGYTLVELVAVIAIMVVMTGALALSLSIVFNEDAQRAVSLIDDELTEARMLSMSKAGEFVLVIDTETNPKMNRIIIKRGGAAYKTIPIDKDVLISMRQGATTVANPGTDIEIKFDKATGSVVSVNGATGTSIENKIYEVMAVAQKGNKPEAKLSLIVNTGRHYIEK